MKHVDEYRDAARIRRLTDLLRAEATRPWTLMEVCGGQTHTIVRYGLDRLLPEGVELVHGPGCPVCVTPVELLDAAQAIAARPGVTLCTFGDMLRVPGSAVDLFQVKARGADVRTIYSPLEALEVARAAPSREVVLFAVGFETTAPATALAAHVAREEGLANFSLLVSHVRVPPAIEAVCRADDNRIQAFLAAGHVCTVMGYEREYPALVAAHRVPIVVTGFEPVDILQGVLLAVRQLEAGRCELENQYARSVRPAGNARALAMMEAVYEVVDRPWRGLGVIPRSGLGLRAEFARFDAARRFGVSTAAVREPGECLAGEVLRGVRKPHQCPAFGTTCTPEHPLGAPMVSSEGACAAYHLYRRHAAGCAT